MSNVHLKREKEKGKKKRREKEEKKRGGAVVLHLEVSKKSGRRIIKNDTLRTPSNILRVYNRIQKSLNG